LLLCGGKPCLADYAWVPRLEDEQKYDLIWYKTICQSPKPKSFTLKFIDKELPHYSGDTMSTKRLRPKERDAIIQSLKAGVTPRIGIQHIQVGRAKEIQALCRDLDRIAEGGSAFRLIIGDYGAGKTFFLSVVRAVALEKKLVIVQADLSPDRRIQATQGQARNLYAELMRNLATRTKPDGNALASVVEKFITQAQQAAGRAGTTVNIQIQERLAALTDYIGGYDFAKVIEAYWQGHESGNDRMKSAAIQWLRAEYPNKTEAKKALGVSTIIGDSSFYDGLKLMSLFVRQAGYAGLLVNLDEMVNLYKLSNTQARTANYEQILRILNDCLQGSASHLGFLLGGTPEFLIDTRKGLYSYEALRSRLVENSFAQRADLIDYDSPCLNLASLTPEELYLLLHNLREVFASGDASRYLVPDEALQAFLHHCSAKIGDAYFRTPRNTIKAFVDLLAVLEQHPDMAWRNLIEETAIPIEQTSDMPEPLSVSEMAADDGLTSFRL
jgi:hypothetical protein